MDVPSMVVAYLTDSRVEFKNKDNLNFATSIRVFVGGRQTPGSPTTNGSSDGPGTLTVEQVKARFAEAWSIHSQRKGELEMARRASKRYQTMDRPPPVDHKDTADIIKQEHPTTLHRPRYSVKTRTRKIKHEPPPARKHYSWKLWKEKPESLVVDATNAKPKSEGSAKTPSLKPARPVGPIDKKQVVQTLG
ncbi:hypothetical protein EC957_011479 [Mortierella hygrophila]|uniref:Uncharacterized protein n=1 Tax=Mortierella hygrophila TaxID=979708 RepID=A0A9P6F8M8_9FUNG|nr:hypothetical protein EC957_011479 [Mortierella hygrophila]